VITGDESWGFECDPVQHTTVKSGTLVTAMPEESKKVQIRNQVKVNLFCEH